MARPTRSDLLTLGLPAPAAVQPPQLVERVDAAGGLLFLHSHGFSTGDSVELQLVRDTTPGASDPSLPIGLEEGVVYTVAVVSYGSFRLASGGVPITSFASSGAGSFSVLLDSGASLDLAIDDAWATIMADCTAHGGDVEAPILSIAARYLAARLYIAQTAAGDPAKATSFDGLASLYGEVYAPKLAAYFRGVPVRGATDATPTVSEGSPRFTRLGSSDGTNFGTGGAGVV